MGEQSLPLLASEGYAPCTFSMDQLDCTDSNGKVLPGLQSWVEIFRSSVPTYIKNALTDETVPQHERHERAGRFQQSFIQYLDALLADHSM